MAKESSEQAESRDASGRFKPGVSGNPGGKVPSEWTWGSLLKEALNKEHSGGKPKKQAVAEMLVHRALAGDVRAFDTIADRMEGKPRQAVDVTRRDPDEVVEIGFNGE